MNGVQVCAHVTLTSIDESVVRVLADEVAFTSATRRHRALPRCAARLGPWRSFGAAAEKAVGQPEAGRSWPKRRRERPPRGAVTSGRVPPSGPRSIPGRGQPRRRRRRRRGGAEQRVVPCRFANDPTLPESECTTPPTPSTGSPLTEQHALVHYPGINMHSTSET